MAIYGVRVGWRQMQRCLVWGACSLVMLTAGTAHALPGVAGITPYQSGDLTGVTVGATLAFEPSDLGRPVQVYVLAQAGNTLLVRDAQGGFQSWAGAAVPAQELNPTTAQMDMVLARNLPLLDLPQFRIFLGYGRDWNEMLQAQRFKQVFPVESDSELLPALPQPLTPQAQKSLEQLLAQLDLRLQRYNPNDPASTSNSDYQRDAALYDQAALAAVRQAQQEERIASQAANTGNINLAPGQSVTIPLDPAGQTPAFCTGSVVCQRSYDMDTGETRITIVGTGTGTGTGTVPPTTSLPTASIDLPGLVQTGTPDSISLQRCMTWAKGCTSSPSLALTALGSGYESLAMQVKLQADSMLSSCASYIAGVYQAQATPTYGNGDAARVTGVYRPDSRSYYLSCRETALVWTYTTGILAESSINVDSYVSTSRSVATASFLGNLAQSKRLGKEKLLANFVVGKVPYLNAVNSGVKCLFGTSAVDMLINQWARTINEVACRQTALNLATSLWPVLNTIPIPMLNSGSLTSASGMVLTAIDASEDFWSRSHYAWKLSNERQGLWLP